MNYPRGPALRDWGGGGDLMTARVSMLLKSRASPDMLPSLFPSWSGRGHISTPVVSVRRLVEDLSVKSNGIYSDQ